MVVSVVGDLERIQTRERAVMVPDVALLDRRPHYSDLAKVLVIVERLDPEARDHHSGKAQTDRHPTAEGIDDTQEQHDGQQRAPDRMTDRIATVTALL
ncbi:hypothetical protein D3C85_1511860 [compost metagenome]